MRPDVGPERTSEVVPVRLGIRVRPGAPGVRVGPGREGLLQVCVPQRAVDGKATEAALKALAQALGVRRRDVILVTGATSRIKVVDIVPGRSGEAALASRIVELLAEGPAGTADGSSLGLLGVVG
jgi:uncharacterized protein YggU (UPF0235/DUF167 family)